MGFRRLLADFTLFSIGGLAGKLIGVLLLPVLARVLTTEELGRFDVLSTLTSVLVSALFLGLDVSAVRLFFDETAEAARARLVGSWMAALAVTTGLTTGGILLARAPISSALFGTSRYGGAVALTAVAYAGASAHHFALTACRMRRRSSTFTWLTVGNLGLYGTLVIALVLSWERTATAAMAALAISSALAGVVGVRLVFRMGVGRPSVATIRRITSIGLPLAPGVIALWGAEFAHRAILLTQAGATQVAYFSIAVRFGSLGVLVGTGLQFAWHPRAFSLGSERAARPALAEEARQIAMCVVALAAAVGIMAPEGVRLVAGSDYAAATAAVGWSCVYALFFGLFQIVSLPSVMDRHLANLGVANGVAAGLSVTGTLLLASRFGAAGGMAAIAAGGAVSVLVVGWSGRTASAFQIPMGRILPASALAIVVVLASTLPSGGAPPLLRAGLAALMLSVLFLERSVPAVLGRLRPSRR